MAEEDVQPPQPNEFEEDPNRPHDTSDPEQTNKRSQVLGRRNLLKDQALREIMSAEHRRLWMYDLLEVCHVHGNVVGDDPYKTYYMIGERNVGMFVMQQLERVCPEQIARMMSEARVKKSRSAKRPAAENGAEQ